MNILYICLLIVNKAKSVHMDVHFSFHTHVEQVNAKKAVSICFSHRYR